MFVGQRGMYFLRTPAWRSGMYAPASPQLPSNEASAGAEELWGLWPRLWGLHVDPTRLASGLPSPGCWLCPWPASSSSADTWASPLAGRVAGTTALRKITGSWFWSYLEPFSCASKDSVEEAHPPGHFLFLSLSCSSHSGSFMSDPLTCLSLPWGSKLKALS